METASALLIHSCNHTRGASSTTYYPPPIPTPNLLSLVFPAVTSLIFLFSRSDQGVPRGTACSIDSVAHSRWSRPLCCQTELEGFGNFIFGNLCVMFSKRNVAVCFLFLRSSLTCPHCLKQSNTFDPFLCISLPIPLRQTRWGPRFDIWSQGSVLIFIWSSRPYKYYYLFLLCHFVLFFSFFPINCKA